MDTIKLDKQGSNVKMIAHRGLSGLERENTCAAFVAAGNRKAYFGIETDVHCTADGKYIVIHDSNTQRVAGVNMVVEASTLAELRSLHLTDLTEKVRADLVLPTLEEYISVCKYYNKIAVLELKNAMSEADVCGIMDTVVGMDYAEQTIVISAPLENLIFLRKHYPDQRVQCLFGDWKPEYLNIMKKYNFGLDIKHRAVTPEMVQQVHDAGLEVNCWTVDTPEDAARVIACGVDYITTNILE